MAKGRRTDFVPRSSGGGNAMGGGMQPGMMNKLQEMQEEIAAVVQIFEPRISPRSLIVQAEKDLNKVEVVIEGDLWTRERPESLRLNAEMDVENGQCVFGDSPYGSPTSSTL